MRNFTYMWEEHLAMKKMGYPFLGHLAEDDRNSLEILNFYIDDCLWTFSENEGNLSPELIVRLWNYKRELVHILKHLDEKLDGYFEHLLLLSNYALRRFKIKEARLIVKREAECIIEEFFSPGDISPFSDFQSDGIVFITDNSVLSIEQSQMPEEMK